MGPAGQGDDGGSAGPAHPIVQWFLDHPDVDRREARLHLRNVHKDEFDDIRTVHQMETLEHARIWPALRYLSAQFDQPEE